MVFTRKREKQNTGRKTDVGSDEFIADVQYKVSAEQAPADPKEKLSWLENVKKYYSERDYKTTVFFHNARGRVASGSVNDDILGATDLLMSPKETIELDGDPETWRPEIDADVVAKMRSLVDRDDLWEPGQPS